MSRPQLVPGYRDSVTFEATEALIDAFAALSGDDNPLHMDERTAREAGFPRRVSHGVLSLAFLSTLIGKKLPGDGALWRSLKVNWLCPVFPGDVIRITGEVVQISASTGSILLQLTAENQHGTAVFKGEANVGVGPVDEAPSIVAQPASARRAGDAPAARPDAPAVLVTGASRGIGRAVAISLGQAGHPVIVGYHRGVEEAQAVVDHIRSNGGMAMPLAMDLSRPLDPFFVHEAASQMGPVLGLVHAASPPLVNLGFEDLRTDHFEHYFRVYVTAAAEMVQALLGPMKTYRFGRVVLLGTSAMIGTPPGKMAAYVAAKSALAGLGKSLALELGPLGVTVNLVSPGLTLTDLTRDFSPRAQMVEAQRTPMRRLALPDDTAGVVRFLMSPEAGFITGVQLPLTGGLTMA